MHRFAMNFSICLARFLGLPEARIPVLTYGCEVVLSTFLSLAAVILGGLVAGVVFLALAAALTGAFLRIAAGGAHAASPYFCALFGGIAFALFGTAARGLGSAVGSFWILLLIVVFTGLLGFLLVHLYAPAGCMARPFRREEEALRKKRAKCVVSGWTLLAGTVLVLALKWQIFLRGEVIFSRQVIFASTLGLWWQIFTLTPVAYRLLPRLEGGLGRLFGERRGEYV